ncbi:MAG TPA: transglutaminase family protein [Xanthobacteraceae bacterium]|nr:transglutaminase family protein [Xanthobacteraceae bacterium]
METARSFVEFAVNMGFIHLTILGVRHTTVYRYNRPVRLGDHRLMLRPRDSHDVRLIETGLNISPAASIRWVHDVFGNSIALASFTEPATELRIESILRLETFAAKRPVFQITPEAVSYPFVYSADDRIDLGRLLERQYPDPANRVGLWARGFVRSNPTDTLALLADLNSGVAKYISYQSRETEGTQTPIETLNRGWGACRDFAVLLIEAARCLGFGARIVSGYLYSPSTTAIGAGTTHAWADIYVPGSGWIAYDPTNGTIDSDDLIRVAVTRDISQAIPISGNFVGPSDSYAGMTVSVTIKPEPVAQLKRSAS